MTDPVMDRLRREVSAEIRADIAKRKADLREQARQERQAELKEELSTGNYDRNYVGMYRPSTFARLGCGCIFDLRGSYTHECERHSGLDAFMEPDHG